MYSNIGRKLKGLGIFFAWLGVVVSCVGAFSLFYSKYQEMGMMKAGIVAGAIIVLGSIVSWLLSWFVYGFGKLIENTSAISYNLEKLSEKGTNLDFSLDNEPSEEIKYISQPKPSYARSEPINSDSRQAVSNEIPLEDFKLPETREEMFESQLKKLKKDYEMSRITYDEYDSAKKKLFEKYK